MSYITDAAREYAKKQRTVDENYADLKAAIFDKYAVANKIYELIEQLNKKWPYEKIQALYDKYGIKQDMANLLTNDIIDEFKKGYYDGPAENRDPEYAFDVTLEYNNL